MIMRNCIPQIFLQRIPTRLLATRAAHKVDGYPSNVGEIPIAEFAVANYRANGHLAATLDPLGIATRTGLPGILPELNALRDEFGQIKVGKFVANTPSELGSCLSSIYCGTIGYEIAHVESAEERNWLYQTIERMSTMQAAPALQKRMAQLLIESEVFDHFMAKRFGQVKRYGLEGGESLMVAIDVILQTAKADHLVFGMAHRGRINLMVGLLGYPATTVFHKLGGNSELPEEWKGSADVLSHLSYTGTIEVSGGSKKKVTMLPNPSHLEAVNPVQQGVVYALQVLGQENALAIQIHGDAAFSGQGIIQETLQLSLLDGFAVKGVVHIITNNQLGYTTTAEFGRSSRYASAPAKMIGAPILHVNGDVPEQVARAVAIGLQYREKFGKDVIIDLICYRRYGHNELDEPSFTQPLIYQKISSTPTLPVTYADNLAQKGLLTGEDAEAIRKAAFETLDRSLKDSASFKPTKFGIQKDIAFTERRTMDGTGISKGVLEEVINKSLELPPEFVFIYCSLISNLQAIHSRLQKYHIDSRLQMFKEDKVDWATAEAMAIGSLLKEGYNVRLSGQDVQRGTFSQRHFAFIDQQTGSTYIPFTSMGKGRVEVINSLLSEFAVVGFEYGVSIASPTTTLPIWEAQFGDFFNGAQIIFDTFVSSGEAKWGLQSGLTILLPHGYDGTGPEHSSCRLERFLQMSNAPYDARLDFSPNWHVVHPTTPANYFHLLRRQLLRPYRKPLIVASPKTLLRLPAAISSINDFTEGTEFQPLIDDSRSPMTVNKLVFCSGKFYYEIEKERADHGVEDMAIIRIEELCPLPSRKIEQILNKYRMTKKVIWCQEEHQNMGPFSYIDPRISSLLPPEMQLEYIGREVSVVPAAGFSKLHKEELSKLIKKLFS